MASDDRVIGELQAQIESIGKSISAIELDIIQDRKENKAELNRRTASQKEWIEKVESQGSTTNDAMIRIEGKLKGVDNSVKSMKRTIGKVIWPIVTAVLTAITLAIWNLLKAG